MRYLAITALFVIPALGGCGDQRCSQPENARARADQLVAGCFTGQTFCSGSGPSRIEEIETVSIDNWAQLQQCGRPIQFDRIEESSQIVSVIYLCFVDDYAIEHRVWFSEIDPPCESGGYQVYRRDEYEAQING